MPVRLIQLKIKMHKTNESFIWINESLNLNNWILLTFSLKNLTWSGEDKQGNLVLTLTRLISVLPKARFSLKQCL